MVLLEGGESRGNLEDDWIEEGDIGKEYKK